MATCTALTVTIITEHHGFCRRSRTVGGACLR